MTTDRSSPQPVPTASGFLFDLDEHRRAQLEKSAPVRRGQGRPVEADSAQTRCNIMDAALECFGRSGFDRTTNSQIAAKAGISPPTLYHYFDSKAALFQAVADDVTHRLYGRFDELMAEQTATVDRVVMVVEVLRDQMAENPHLAGFIATYAAEVRRNPEVLRLSPPQLWSGPVGYYTELARYGQAQGDLAEDVDPAAVAGLIMGLIYGISLLASVAPNTDFAAEVVGAFDRLIRGTLFGAEP